MFQTSERNMRIGVGIGEKITEMHRISLMLVNSSGFVPSCILSKADLLKFDLAYCLASNHRSEVHVLRIRVGTILISEDN